MWCIVVLQAVYQTLLFQKLMPILANGMLTLNAFIFIQILNILKSDKFNIFK
eukprot:c4970_g1_i1 orf=136-291(+)